MHHALKQKAIHLRITQQLSYSAILKQIPVAKSTLSEWLKPYPLTKERILELRQSSWKSTETKIELFRARMKEKREQHDLEVYKTYALQFNTIDKSSFFTAGLMLYLAEGTKTNPYLVTLTNTNLKLIRFFITWLTEFFNVPRSRLRIFLQLYPTMDIDKEINFWLNELRLPKEQLYKPFIRKLTPSSFSYPESSRHGICAIMLSDTKVKRRIMMAIQAYLDKALTQFTGD